MEDHQPYEWKTPRHILVDILRQGLRVKVTREDSSSPLVTSLFNSDIFVENDLFNMDDNLHALGLVSDFSRALIYEARLHSLVNSYLETVDARKKNDDDLHEAVEKLIKDELTRFEQRLDTYLTDMLIVRAGLLEIEQVTPNVSHHAVINLTRRTELINIVSDLVVYVCIAEMTGYMPIPLYAGLNRDNAMNIDRNLDQYRDKEVAEEIRQCLDHTVSFSANRCIVEIHVYQDEKPIETYRYAPKTKQWIKFPTIWEV